MARRTGGRPEREQPQADHRRSNQRSHPQAAVLIDIRRRPASQIRGSKRMWIIAAVLVNSAGVGPLSYFAFGRRRRAEGVELAAPARAE